MFPLVELKVPVLIWIDQLDKVPVLLDASSMINVQVPFGLESSIKSLKGVSGWKLPVKGDDPWLIGVLASSSKVVLVKFWPDPSSFERVTILPSGALSLIIKALSKVSVRFRVALTWVMT